MIADYFFAAVCIAGAFWGWGFTAGRNHAKREERERQALRARYGGYH